MLKSSLTGGATRVSVRPSTPLGDMVLGLDDAHYAYIGATGVVKSTDLGNTWIDYYTARPVMGFVPKDATNAAFTLNMSGGGNTIALVRKLPTDADGDPWVDLTAALATFATSVGKTGKYWCHRAGAVRLEEESV